MSEIEHNTQDGRENETSGPDNTCVATYTLQVMASQLGCTRYNDGSYVWNL